MSQIVLGIGDLGASNTPGGLIKTFALGSCVGVVMLDPKSRTVGMAHVALPESRINPQKMRERPGYFADTAIPLLLKEMARLGAPSNGRGVLVKLAGGASIMDPNETFNIGKRNVLAIKKALWAHGMGAMVEDVGGNHSRTLSVSVNTGEIIVSCPGRGQWTL